MRYHITVFDGPQVLEYDTDTLNESMPVPGIYVVDFRRDFVVSIRKIGEDEDTEDTVPSGR